MPSVTSDARDAGNGRSSVRKKSARGEGSLLRGELLDATVGALAESGDPADVSIRAVARATGVSPTAVYQHFTDRDELLAAACDHTFARFGEWMAAAAEAGTGPADRLRRVGEAYFRFADEQPGLYRVLFSNPLHHAHEHDDAASFLADDMPGAAAFAYLVSLVRDCLDAGAGGLSGGTEDPQVESVRLAFHIWAWLHGIVDLRITHAPMPWPSAERMLGDIAVALGLTSP